MVFRLIRFTSAILAVSAASAAPGPVRRDIDGRTFFYSKQAGLLYVQTSPLSSHLPNSIVALDPVTGNDVYSIALGAEGTALIPSDDGIHVYVYLPGANILRRINLSTKQTDFEFETSLPGAAAPQSAVVPPGDPDRVVVAYVDPWGYDAGVAAYVRGVQLPDIGGKLERCAFSGTADTLWCIDRSQYDLWKVHLDSTGLHPVEGWSGLAYGMNSVPIFSNGLLYFKSLARVVDPEARTIIGHYPWVGNTWGGFTVDGDENRVYFANAGPSSSQWCTEIWALDAAKFLATGHYLDCSSSNVGTGPIVRVGPGGLAMLGGSPFQGGSVVAFFPLSGIPTLEPVSPGPITTSADGVNRLALPNNGLAFDKVSNRLFATVPDSVPGIGNSVVPIDAATLTPGTPVWIGSRPFSTAISDDGKYLYEGFNGGSLVQRLNLQSMTPDFAFPIFSRLTGSPISAGSILPFSGASDTVAVASVNTSLDPPADSVVIYDHGIARPDFELAPQGEVEVLQWDSTGTVIYGFSTTGSPYRMSRLQPTSTGVKWLDSFRGSSDWSNGEVRCQQDVCFDLLGDVIDAKGLKLLGKCPLTQALSYGRVLPDVARSRVWYLTASNTAIEIQSCDLSTFQPAETVSIPASNASPVELLFTDPETFAISTANEVLTVPRMSARPSPTIQAVANAASWSHSGFAPGSIVTISGTGLANWAEVASAYPLSQSLGETHVNIGGSLSYLFYASSSQINALVPSSLAPGPAEVLVTVNGQTSRASINIVPTAPGLFNVVDGKRAAALNADYSINLPTNPAKVGSVIMVYFTGQGRVATYMNDGQAVPAGDPQAYRTLASTTAAVGGKAGVVLYSGLAPGFDGVAQANIQVPELPDGDYDLVIIVGGATSNSGTISISH